MTIAKALPYSCISLAVYADFIGVNECAFFGVNTGTNNTRACDKIWMQAERDMVARYLAEAQEEIENVTHYPLCARWFENEQHPYLRSCQPMIHTKWRKLIEVGVKAVADVSLGATPDYSADPAEVIVPTSVTDTSELHVFYPGSDREIDPESIELSTTSMGVAVAIIKIPWCRLVDPSNFDNDEEGLDYTDTSIYTPTVDVKHIYNDTTNQGVLVYPHQDSAESSCHCCTPTCGETTHTLCAYIRNAETGALDVLKAGLVSGVLTAESCNCNCKRAQLVRVNYRAGLNPITEQAKNALIRLAHSKMPKPPCGCDAVNDVWKRDNEIPETLTGERLNCPFGLSNGAWVAWRFANAIASRRLLVL